MNNTTKKRNLQLDAMEKELVEHRERLGIAKRGLKQLEDAETLGEMKQSAETTVHALEASSVELELDQSTEEEIGDVLAQAIPIETMLVTDNRKERRRKERMARRGKARLNRGFTKSIKKNRNRKKR